jgi:hypothetical protein
MWSNYINALLQLNSYGIYIWHLFLCLFTIKFFQSLIEGFEIRFIHSNLWPIQGSCSYSGTLFLFRILFPFQVFPGTLFLFRNPVLFRNIDNIQKLCSELYSYSGNLFLFSNHVLIQETFFPYYIIVPIT